MPKKRRIVDHLPDALMKDIIRSRKLIAKELPELVEKGQRLHDAKNERTHSGALRRAIHSSKLLGGSIHGGQRGRKTLPASPWRLDRSRCLVPRPRRHASRSFGRGPLSERPGDPGSPAIHT